MSELVPQTDVDASNVIDAQQQPEKASKNILVAVDGSRVSRKAMATAATLCHQQNNRVSFTPSCNLSSTAVQPIISANLSNSSNASSSFLALL